MTYGEIEFLDEPIDDVDAGELSGARPVRPWRRRTPVLLGASALAWSAAAVLAVIAPFRAAFGTRVPSVVGLQVDQVGGFSVGRDGWGRALEGGPNQGGVRFGIALCGCALVFAVLTGLTGWRAVRELRGRPPRLRRVSAALAVGAPCLLAGTVAALALYVNSMLAPAAAGGRYVDFLPVNPDSNGVEYSSSLSIFADRYSVGGCVWVSVAALGCAVVAAAATLATLERRRP